MTDKTPADEVPTALMPLVEEARSLRSDGENPEYDRALVELVCSQLGSTDEWREIVQDWLGISYSPELDKTSPYDVASLLHGVLYEGASLTELDDAAANLADAQLNPILVRTNNIAQFMLRLRNGKLFRISIMDGFEQDWLSTVERND